MMKKIVLALLATGALLSTGCNSIGDKDTIIGRVDGESIYQEDVDLMVRLQGLKSTDPVIKSASTSLFSRNAIRSAALAERPKIQKDLDSRSKTFEDYLLTFAYQRFYVVDRLMFNDSELLAFFDSHRSLFGDSVEYMEVRNQVAEQMFLERNADSLASFIEMNRTADDTTEASREKLSKQFLQEFLQHIMQTYGDSLTKVYNLAIVPIVPPTPEEYYESHKSLFVTDSGYEVYHVEMADSVLMTKLFFADSMDLDEFKKLARENSLNKVTAAEDGYVGKVLEHHVLPYGIGDMTPLFAMFKDKPVGSVSAPIRTFMGETFHVFYLASVVPSRQKSFEQVKLAIENEIKNSINYELDSMHVLVTLNGEPIVRERDVQEVFRANIGMRRNKSIHDRVVHSLFQNAAFALEAKKTKVDHSWEYRALKRQSELEFICEAYHRYYMNYVNHSDDSLKALFDSLSGNPIHPNEPFETSKADLSDWLNMPRNMLVHRYFYAMEDYLPKTLDENPNRVFDDLIVKYRNARWDSVTIDIWAKARVSLYKDDIELPAQKVSSEYFMYVADSLYKNRRFREAYETLESLRMRSFGDDSLVKKVTYEIAHYASEMDDFNIAQREYRAFYSMWPDSPDAEKALFSRGFILTENLHKDSLAMEVFEEFKAKYPKSELMESVDWLIENIKTGGKLADDLMKKISEE